MATSVWSQVVDALVDAMRAQSGCRAPGADADEDLVLVLDGPEVWLTEEPAPLLLIVGGAGDDDDEPGVSGQSRATATGARSRDEVGAITCSAIAQCGGIMLPDATLVVPPPTIRSLRAQAFGVMALVETVLRASPTLGFSSVQHMDVQVGSRIVVQQYLADDGAVCSVVFTVDYSARI